LFANYCDNDLHKCCMPHFYHVPEFFFPLVLMLTRSTIGKLHAYLQTLSKTPVSFLVMIFSSFYLWM
jgi:hypothetical protein